MSEQSKYLPGALAAGSFLSISFVACVAHTRIAMTKEGENMHRFMIPRVAHCSDGCKHKS